MEQRTLLERLARHLAANDPDRWREQVEDAASLLALIKNPDDTMREAGDERVWQAMIDAALRERWSLAPGPSSADPPAGTDEEGEIPLPPDAVSGNHAGWVHLHETQEKPR